MSAADDGALAFLDGQPLSANPWTETSLVKHSEWRRGWMQAERADDDASGDLFRGMAK